MNNRGCLGRKMYSDSTLKGMAKDELIDLLHLADYNYRNLEDTYEHSVSNSNRILHEYDKVFKAAAGLLEEATGNGALPCPLEYIGRCKPHKTNCNVRLVILKQIGNLHYQKWQKKRWESNEQI